MGLGRQKQRVDAKLLCRPCREDIHLGRRQGAEQPATGHMLIAYERQFQCTFLSFEGSIPARPCADRCATGKCQPCLIAMKRRPKHKAPPARAETP